MTYREAKRVKPGDKLTLTGKPWHQIPHPEQVAVLQAQDDRSIKPPAVLFTVDSPSMGRVTLPHSHFQPPILYESTGGPGIDEIIAWALRGPDFE